MKDTPHSPDAFPRRDFLKTGGLAGVRTIVGAPPSAPSAPSEDTAVLLQRYIDALFKSQQANRYVNTGLNNIRFYTREEPEGAKLPDDRGIWQKFADTILKDTEKNAQKLDTSLEDRRELLPKLLNAIGKDGIPYEPISDDRDHASVLNGAIDAEQKRLTPGLLRQLDQQLRSAHLATLEQHKREMPAHRTVLENKTGILEKIERYLKQSFPDADPVRLERHYNALQKTIPDNTTWDAYFADEKNIQKSVNDVAAKSRAKEAKEAKEQEAFKNHLETQQQKAVQHEIVGPLSSFLGRPVLKTPTGVVVNNVAFPERTRDALESFVRQHHRDNAATLLAEVSITPQVERGVGEHGEYMRTHAPTAYSLYIPEKVAHSLAQALTGPRQQRRTDPAHAVGHYRAEAERCLKIAKTLDHLQDAVTGKWAAKASTRTDTARSI